MKYLYYFLLTGLLSCHPEVQEQQTYIFPKGYRGTAIIIYNQQNGKSKEYLGKNRLLRIPPSGVLLTQFDSKSTNQLKDEFYYQNKDGSLIKLNLKNIDSNYTAIDTTVMVLGINGNNTFQKNDRSEKFIYDNIFLGAVNSSDIAKYKNLEIQKLADSLYK